MSLRHLLHVQEEAPLVRLSYLLGTEPVTMLPSPYLSDKCASLVTA